MAVSPILAEIDALTTKATTVMGSASAFIRGTAARVQAAVDAALDLGASKEQLAPVQAEVDAMNASADDLASAIAENTVAANEGGGTGRSR